MNDKKKTQHQNHNYMKALVAWSLRTIILRRRLIGASCDNPSSNPDRLVAPNIDVKLKLVDGRSNPGKQIFCRLSVPKLLMSGGDGGHIPNWGLPTTIGQLLILPSIPCCETEGPAAGKAMPELFHGQLQQLWRVPLSVIATGWSLHQIYDPIRAWVGKS